MEDIKALEREREQVLRQLIAAREAELLEIKRNRIKLYYPDEGPLRRELYPKHIALLNAGAKFRQRFAIAANRTGKSEGIAGFETACHVMGWYPEWWEGRRFLTRPITALCAANEPKLLRTAIQKKLLYGPGNAFGEGLIMASAVSREDCRVWPNGGGAFESVKVKHSSGGMSEIVFKTYEQGRTSFESVEVDWFWMDEEVPEDVYDEVLTRTMTTNGCGIVSYTPLKGKTALTVKALRESYKEKPTIFVQNITWEDVPHLSEAAKAELISTYPQHLRAARTKGIAVQGIGMVYPVDEDTFVIPPLKALPPGCYYCFGFDGGWHNTACVWLAWDKDTDTVYAYSEYKRGEVEIPIHASAMKARGVWIPGVGDAAATSNYDGKKLIELYRGEGIRMRLPDKAVSAGIQAVQMRLQTGRLKVYNTCTKLIDEIRTYSYDENQQIEKVNDHLMDALRYGIFSGLKIAVPKHQDIRPTVPEQTFGIYA